MKKYDSYKEAGIKWLCQIPEHWKIITNKYLLSLRDEVSISGDEELLNLSQYTGITPKRNSSKNVGMHMAESLVGYKIVHKDDIVMNIMLAWNGSTAVSKYEGIISPAYEIYHLISNNINPKYLHYLYRISLFTKYFEAFSTGVIKSRLRLYSDKFLHMYSIVPPREEQDKIVRFFDWKVS